MDPIQTTAPVTAAPQPEKAPTLLLVITTLIMIVSILSALAFAGLILLFSSAAPYALPILLIPIAMGAAGIYIAYGLRRMKLWALYSYSTISGLSILYSIYTSVTGATTRGLASLVIPCLILVYLWSIREKFKPASL